MRNIDLRLLQCVASVAFASGLAGCAGGVASSDVSVTEGTALGTVQGYVQSGSQGVGGSHVYVYAAGTTGYGGVSTSLLMADATGSYPTSADADGNYYVTTDATGAFALGDGATCVAGTQIYLLGRGGSVGTGDANDAIGMMAALGQCPASGTMASVLPTVVVNEVSTVAMAYAVAGFATDATHVASSGTALAQTGIANAFSNAGNLYSLTAGASGALAVTPAGNGVVPQTTIHSIANALAACNESPAEGSSQCSTLFENVQGGPTETATAAIDIAHNPGTAVAALFALQPTTGAAFGPALAAAPNDFSIAITYGGGGLAAPEFVAIDGVGDTWVSNTGGSTVTELSSTGAVLSGAAGYSAGGLTMPLGVAIDSLGNAWVVSGGATGSVVEFSSAGSVLSGSSGYAGGTLVLPQAVAINGAGDAWVASNEGTLTELGSSGSVLATIPQFLGPLSQNQVIELDGVGHVFELVSDTDGGPGGELAEFSGTGTLMMVFGADRPSAFALDGSGAAWVGSDWYFLYKYDGSSSPSTVQGGGVLSSYGMATDGAGNVWTTNPNIGDAPSPYHDSISAFSNAGVALSPSAGFTPGGLSTPWGEAIDGSGDVWVTNQSGNSVTELIGAAVPVVTPLVVGVGNNTLGTRP